MSGAHSAPLVAFEAAFEVEHGESLYRITTDWSIGDPVLQAEVNGNAIAMQLENVVSPRPMTHDLLKSVVEGLQAANHGQQVDSACVQNLTNLAITEAVTDLVRAAGAADGSD